ncbi:MAG: hypothetical protein AAF564_23460 [Bacteroidota bacterium]
MKTTDRLPFFEVEPHPADERFGSIKAHSDTLGPVGQLDYFHGNSSDIYSQVEQPKAFYITSLAIKKGDIRQSLEKGLLYLAACIADSVGEEVIYCRPSYAAVTPMHRNHDLWEIIGVRKLLDNYKALSQAV